MTHPHRIRALFVAAVVSSIALAAPAVAQTKGDPKSAAGRYEVYHVKFPTVDVRTAFEKGHADFAKSGVYIYLTIGSFADVFVDPAHENAFLKDVSAVKGWAEGAGDIVVPPPRSSLAPGKPKSEPERIFRGDERLRGKGVIVAIVDSGIDFRHDDFVRKGPDGKKTSRILYFWDTTVQAPKSGPGSRVRSKYLYPTGEPIGTVYAQDELTAELNAPAGQRQIRQTDTNGHGTACAGVAAGNGNGNSDLHGVAPEADLIAVRVGGDGNTFDNAYLLNAACGWIDEMAGTKCAVVSCSFGGQYGSHDGQLVNELQLSERFPLDRPGRAICISAGNEGDKFIHAEITLAGDTRRAQLKWLAPSAANVNLFFNTDSPDDVEIQGDDIKVATHEINRVTGRVQSRVRVRGNGELRIVRKHDKTIQADAYIVGDGAEFTQYGIAVRKQVGTPGTASHPITVGSYDWNDVFPKAAGKAVPMRIQRREKNRWMWENMTIGELSSYSSPGPSRLVHQGDHPKPDIVAPGQYFVAPCSAVIPADEERDVVKSDDGKYRDFNGTSAATPYVAGVVALMFEAKPSLTLGEIKALFSKHATRVPDMRRRPDSWGHGKLDRQAVLRIFEELQPDRANN